MSASKYFNNRQGYGGYQSHSAQMREYYNYRYCQNYAYTKTKHYYSPLPTPTYHYPAITSTYTTGPALTNYTKCEEAPNSKTTTKIPIVHVNNCEDNKVAKLAKKFDNNAVQGKGRRCKGAKFIHQIDEEKQCDDGQDFHKHHKMKLYHVKQHQQDQSQRNHWQHGKKKPPKPDDPEVGLVSVDLCIAENSKAHHTDYYEICQDEYVDDITKKYCHAQLVIRRGQKFKVKVFLDYPYDDVGQFRVISTIGNAPLCSKGTHNQMITGETAEDGDWSVKVVSANCKEVELSVLSPANCAVGKWDFAFDMVKTDDDDKVVGLPLSKTIKLHAYILFNAWCRKDAVYMENPQWRQEYVMNDTGKLFMGNYKQMYGKPWNFGQFESVSLEAALYILNHLANIPVTFRGSPIVISRMLSALVNSCDDRGILCGRWDGEYSGGICPTKWTGSVAILVKYMRTKQPVEYGQCWVFSGVLTTVCRALGIPTRSVTNFASAHDTDGSLTIDMHWDENDEHMPELDSDSIWNFHVWNECWMTRPDLQAGYGGWQVVDSTPQETSDGIYCAGPASVAAIKSGDVGVTFDTPFIFAEVNADRINWCRQKDGSVRKVFERDVVGRNISTKAIGTSRDVSIRNCTPDREDITSTYKYAEGSYMERAAVWRAARMSTKPNIYTGDDVKEDVLFCVKDIDDVFVGSNFKIPIEIRNTSSECRTLCLTASLSSVYYTGVMRTKLKRQTFHEMLLPHRKVVVTMAVSASDYLSDMTDNSYAMKINYLANVVETKQIYASQDDFRLRTIIPDVTPSCKNVSIGDVFTVKTSFMNPLDVSLTNCVFSFEAAGNLKPVDISKSGRWEHRCITVGPGSMAEAEVEITAKRAGECVVISSFECKEMGDLQGQCTVTIHPRC